MNCQCRTEEREEWRDVPGYEGLYQVSSLGRVRSLKTWLGETCRIASQWDDKSGRKCVTLHNDNGKRNHFVHRLVAYAFIPNHDGKPEIDHIDGNQKNNRRENLRWATRKENQNNPITRERMSKSARISRVGKFGRDSRAAKPVVCVETGKLYWGAAEADRMTGISYACISMACRGVTKTAGGFHWRFADKEAI